MTTDWQLIDEQHIWHPYSAIGAALPCYPVVSAAGVRIKLRDGRELIDGMSSWWSAIHGYNNPVLNEAIKTQLDTMSHVMFGGLTHQTAAELSRRLLSLTPDSLSAIFLADSGSVSVEVAMKMAIQYWYARNKPAKQHFLTVRGGYHGDTFGAMSVCDPVTGMHGLFEQSLSQQYFVDKPDRPFGEACKNTDLLAMRSALEKNHQAIAAVILEPIVQATGGMNFYSADYLNKLRSLCDEFGVLLIFDEIATGFGRTGKMFATEHTKITPDILCVGKALTGGYMTLAATLTTEQISQTIQSKTPHVFMHGPTFMANPLACAVATASIDLLLASSWQQKISAIAAALEQGLASCRGLDQVADVRVLGGIGVVELKQPVDMQKIQPAFVEQGVWVRPFGRLVYLMPPYIMTEQDLSQLTAAVCRVVASIDE